jgi:hypothetical protein
MLGSCLALALINLNVVVFALLYGCMQCIGVYSDIAPPSDDKVEYDPSTSLEGLARQMQEPDDLLKEAIQGFLAGFRAEAMHAESIQRATLQVRNKESAYEPDYRFDFKPAPLHTAKPYQ